MCVVCDISVRLFLFLLGLFLGSIFKSSFLLGLLAGLPHLLFFSSKFRTLRTDCSHIVLILLLVLLKRVCVLFIFLGHFCICCRHSFTSVAEAEVFQVLVLFYSSHSLAICVAARCCQTLKCLHWGWYFVIINVYTRSGRVFCTAFMVQLFFVFWLYLSTVCK